LITHRLPLAQLLDGIHIASHPTGDSLKVVISP
jgi:hypothetical protein